MSLLPEIDEFIQLRKAATLVPFTKSAMSTDIHQICDALIALTGTWNPIEFLTPEPVSRRQERDKFFAALAKGEEYNPTFQYDAIKHIATTSTRTELTALLHRAETLPSSTPQDVFYRSMLIEKIQDDLATCDLVDAINETNEERIRVALHRKYPPLDPTIHEYAHSRYAELANPTHVQNVLPEPPLLTVEQQTILHNTIVTAQEMKDAFEWVLRGYGMLRDEEHPVGFTVSISERAVNIDVRDKSDHPMTIVIPSDRTFAADKLLEIVTHEIEGHARQSINAIKMFGVGGGQLKMDGEVAYEGLAKRLDESFWKRFFGSDRGMPKPWYPIAIEMAERGASFFAIFRDQAEKRMHEQLHIPSDQPLVVDPQLHAAQIAYVKFEAWSTAYNVLRGHIDTRNVVPFAMTKDLSYFKGWLLDKQLLEAGCGEFNEMAIWQPGQLALLAPFDLGAKDLPHPYLDLTKEYCFSVLLPKLDAVQ